MEFQVKKIKSTSEVTKKSQSTAFNIIVFTTGIYKMLHKSCGCS